MIDTIKAWLTSYALWLALGACVAMGTLAGVQTLRLAWAKADLATEQAKTATAEAIAQEAARKESERKDAASSSATQSMLDYLGANLPAIETRTHDTIERIRTVYRTTPAAAVCQRPDSVRIELTAARARANGTAPSGLPAQRTSAGSADPGAQSDGRVGDHGDGDHRDSTSGVDSRIGVHGQAQGGAGDPLIAAALGNG